VIERRTRLRRTPIGSERLDFDPGHDGPAWRAALEKLGAILAAGRPAATRLRLSGQFCRFALIPWSRGLTREEELALARAVFAQTYGEAAHGWEIRVDNLRRGALLLAGAVDAGLIAGLVGAFSSHRWRLDALEPLLAGALAGGDEQGARWNALVEPDWWTAVLAEGEALLGVRSLPAQPGGLETLFAALENENVRLARPVRSLRLLPGSTAVPASLRVAGWTVEPAGHARRTALREAA
jgi:hypothetical protein